jgi:hypothetical protein
MGGSRVQGGGSDDGSGPPDRSSGGSGNRGGYSYDWFTGNYTDGCGSIVSWDEVYHNYVLPNSTTISFGQTSGSSRGYLYSPFWRSNVGRAIVRMLGGTFSGMSTGNRGYGEGVLWNNNPYGLDVRSQSQMLGQNGLDWDFATPYEDGNISNSRSSNGMTFKRDRAGSEILDENGHRIPDRKYYWVNTPLGGTDGWYAWQKPYSVTFSSPIRGNKKTKGHNPTLNRASINFINNIINMSLRTPIFEINFFNQNQAYRASDDYQMMTDYFGDALIQSPVPNNSSVPYDPKDGTDNPELTIFYYTW